MFCSLLFSLNFFIYFYPTRCFIKDQNVIDIYLFLSLPYQFHQNSSQNKSLILFDPKFSLNISHDFWVRFFINNFPFSFPNDCTMTFQNFLSLYIFWNPLWPNLLVINDPIRCDMRNPRSLKGEGEIQKGFRDAVIT